MSNEQNPEVTAAGLTAPVMFYFGPWDCAGHYLFSEGGGSVDDRKRGDFPWDEWGRRGDPIDGCLQPGCVYVHDRWEPRGPQVEGQAVLHHKKGWTALCFWDRSVDSRGGCNSNYFARGTFTFDQMVAMAKERFAVRWNRMKFEVSEVKP